NRLAQRQICHRKSHSAVEMAEEDLYGDLDTSADALKIKGLEAELSNSEALRKSLEVRLSEALRKEKLVREENEQLAKNISCLFNTARAEITRKNTWIDRLRRQLEVAEGKLKQKGESRR
ncbi:unnamed protein product, partial [Hapterophycus canaliculatus]